MQTEDTYKTIEKSSEGFFKDKGSKFISLAFPVDSELKIQEYRTFLRKKYHDARHHVYAFYIGKNQVFYRSSDDGEPTNSSGPPILGQIRSYGLTNILIVVVRYFGGTKLGIPGLINAYKTAAADAIENAHIVTKTITKKVSFEFKYPAMNQVMRIVKDPEIIIERQEFLENCMLEINVSISNFEKVYNKLELIKSVKFISP
ncbi:MAG: YigZ family protein [Bacteroidetes bacterium]|nr:MAG: YigZ family protein [Bacteroidota bacterium]